MQVAVEPEQRCERNLFLHSSALNDNMKDEQYRQDLTTDEALAGCHMEQGCQYCTQAYYDAGSYG